MSRSIILHLTLIDGVGPSTIKQLIEGKPDQCAWSDLYHFSLQDWKETFDCSDRLGSLLVKGLSDRSVLEKEQERIEKHHAQWVTLIDYDYPQSLYHIHYPPAVVWWQGSACWKDDEHLFAIVGSRKANFYAQEVVDSFVPPLVTHGWTIVSGGALGVDGMAHAATVCAGGKTVVVLGSGLAHKYPQAHIPLFESIIASGGSLISIFSVNTPAHPTNFPIRNRVVSGLSRGCFVVQAAVKSGARITAQHALEQGRDVFALPGSIKDPLSAGCHALIQQGAKLVTSVDDILSEYHVVFSDRTTRRDDAVAQQSLVSEAATAYTQSTIDIVTPEGIIKAACVTPLSTDELLEITQLSLTQLQSLLFQLQLEGVVKQDFTGLWTR